MQRKRHTSRERLFVTGGVLLLLLAAGVIVSGRIINRRAAQMSDRIVTQISESHCLLLQNEVDRTEGILTAATRFLQRHDTPSGPELQTLATTLLDVDSKAREIWFSREGDAKRRRCLRNGTLLVEPTAAICPAKEDSVVSTIVSEEGTPVWVLACTVRDPAGKRCLCGIDYPLPELYTYMSEQNPHSRSSAILLNPEGVIVYHPDSLKLGQRIGSEHGTDGKSGDFTGSETEAFRRVLATGQSVITETFSDYLGMEEQRIYYPIQLAGQRWVAGIGIPRLVIEQEIDDFHLYTILTAAVSVLLFAALLVAAQRRWRREYALRRLSERESAQLQLQQVIDQIDPHFLFNSLNSLYALIRCNPEQAREFTLTLSRVYRRVLERRKQILASLAEEIDFTWQYHTLQQIRFGENLTLTTTIDTSLRRHRIPAMSLQTLVENAVKHNRVSTRTPLHIDIRTEGDSLVIENNRTPHENENTESLGVGLERIRSIYRFYTDRNLEITIDPMTFRCSLPLLPPEK